MNKRASLCLATSGPGSHLSDKYSLYNYYKPGSMLKKNEEKPGPSPWSLLSKGYRQELHGRKDPQELRVQEVGEGEEGNQCAENKIRRTSAEWI